MIEWITDHWLPVAGTIASLVGAAYVPYVRTMIVKGAQALMSEVFLKELFVSLAQKYVRSTKTKLDDVWLAQLKKKL